MPATPLLSHCRSLVLGPAGWFQNAESFDAAGAAMVSSCLYRRAAYDLLLYRRSPPPGAQRGVMCSTRGARVAGALRCASPLRSRRLSMGGAAPSTCVCERLMHTQIPLRRQ